MVSQMILDENVTTKDVSVGRVARASLVEITGSIGLKAAAVLQTVVIARLYNMTEIGAWATALLVIGAATALVTLRLDLFLLARPESSDVRKDFDVAFTLSLMLGVAGMALLIGVASLLTQLSDNTQVGTHVRYLSPLMLGVALTLPAVAWERQLQYGWSKLPPFLGIIAFIAIAAAGRIWWDWSVLGLLSAQLASFVASAAALWLFAPIRPRLTWHSDHVGPQVAFGTPLLVSGVASFIAGQGDDLLVLLLHGTSALGLYVVAFYLPSYVLALVEMIARVAVPALSPLRNSATALNRAFTQFARYIAAVSVAAGFGLALFAREIVLLLYGPEWVDAVVLVRIFSVAFVLRASTGLHWQILAVITGRTRYLMWTSFASAAFMLIVAPPLIWRFGLTGGAIYSFAQFAVMGPLVRFPLIKSTLGDLSFLRSAIAPLISGTLASLTTVVLWSAAGMTAMPSFGLAMLALSVYILSYLTLLHCLDSHLIPDAVRAMRAAHG